MRKSNTDTRVYLIFSWVTFGLATIISAYLNIQLFTNLEQSHALLLGAMSICLEGGKILTLISANTLSAIHKRISGPKIFWNIFGYYVLYLVFGALAIAASLGFSLTATNKIAEENTLKISGLQDDIALVTVSEENYTAAYNTLFELENNMDNQITELRSTIANYNTQESDLTARINTYYNSGLIQSEEGNSWREGYSQANYNDLIQQRTKIRTDRTTANGQLTDINEGRAVNRAKERLVVAEAERDENRTLYGTLNKLNADLREAQAQELKDAGSSRMFILLAETFKIPDYVQQIKFVMLMFISILIELLIFTFSPDVTIDRSLLLLFKKAIPKNTDIDKVIKDFEDEYKKFSLGDNLKLSMTDKRLLNQRVKELTDLKIEKVNELHEREMDKLKNEVERANSLRTENEDSYQKLLDKQKVEMESLEQKLKEVSQDKKLQDLKKYDIKEEPVDNAIPIPVVKSFKATFAKPIKKEFEPIVEEPVKEIIIEESVKEKVKEPVERIMVEELKEIVEEPKEDILPEPTIEPEPVPEIFIPDIEQHPEDALPNIINDDHELEKISNTMQGEIKKSKHYYNRIDRIKTPLGDIPIEVKETLKEEPPVPDIRYRFGRTSTVVISHLIKFINEIAAGKEPGDIIEDPQIAGRKLDLGEDITFIFLKRLGRLKIGEKPLIENHLGEYIINFDAQTIIDYSTERLPE